MLNATELNKSYLTHLTTTGCETCVMSSRPVNPGVFHDFVERKRAAGELIVQPRMGFSNFAKMRQGLEAVKDCPMPTIGTITLDSYTRQGQIEQADHALARGNDLNGYPMVSHGTERNRELVRGLLSSEFPIQVRHGTPLPDHVVRAVIDAGLEVTEGGPISYCLPYGRSSLHDCLEAWGRCTQNLASLRERGTIPHLESFGGCMLGQLCPPSLLVAISILEGLFSVENGIVSLSLSYAQGYNSAQDVGAILALRKLASEFLQGAAWHVVVYTFMGLFPATPQGARWVIEESARVAAASNSERLIVKTAAEAHRIPTIGENVAALSWAFEAAKDINAQVVGADAKWHREAVYAEAKFLIDLVLDLDPSLPRAIETAFQKGFLDVPYCLHPNNRNRTRSCLDINGCILWASTGYVPFPRYLNDACLGRCHTVTSSELQRMLRFNIEKYDGVTP